MPARKKKDSLQKRIDELIDREMAKGRFAQTQADSDKSNHHKTHETNLRNRAGGEHPDEQSAETEQIDSLNLGTETDRMIVSLESFIVLNFELSRELDILVENWTLDENQKEWNEWGNDRSESNPRSGLGGTEFKHQVSEYQDDRMDGAEDSMFQTPTEPLNEHFRSHPK